MKQSGNQKRPAPAESIHGAERGRAGGYRAQDVLWEIKSRRGPAEKHFHMADGTDIAVAYERPVHYRAEDGSFQEIDSRLSLSQGAERRYKNAAGPMRLSLAEDGGAERLASISHGGYTVALTPQGRGRGKGRLRQKGRAWPQDSFEARVLPRREQSAVDYEEAFPEADLEYLATESLLKENIIVKRPGGSYVYDFLLETDGLSPVSLESGGIELRDGVGKAVFAIPPGYMEDAQGRSSSAVSYELSPRGGDRFLLSVRAEASWMNAAERAFPVTIDPPVSIQGFYNIETGTLHESVPDGVGGQAAMESLGYYAALGKSCRVLVRVNNLPSLPDNSYVVYGGLYLYQLAYADINMPALRIQAQPLLYNSPTEGYWCLYHTWNDCPALGPAADWTDIVNSRQFYSWNLTREAIKWYNDPANNYGVCLRASKEGSMTGGSCANTGLASSNTSNGGARPYFVVQYRSRAGIEPYYSYQSHPIDRAGVGYIGDYSGQLTLMKSTLSAAGTVNAAGMSHVYNSMYSGGEYSGYITGATGKYTGMKLGRGWMLDIQQTVSDAGGGYLLYADGDGTLHYFYPEGSVYKDEDGLGLSITKSGNNYTLRDKKDNISYFSNGVLSYRQDANGNRVSCVVNGSGQITALTRQNSGHSLETLASLSYNGSGYLTTIQDQAGRVTGFGYDGAGRLVSVTHPDGSSVSYGYNSGAKLLYARDNESGYAMHYEYSGSTGKISRFYERSGESQGATVTVGGGYNGIQSYRHCGPDRVSGNSDDIISHYVLDYFGRSTSSYTTSADMKRIYSATCSAYSQNSGVSAQNNRLLISSAGGAQAINLLSDSGVERQSALGPTSSPWRFAGGGTAVFSGDRARTGLRSVKLSRAAGDAESVLSQSVSGLSPNGWYLLSAYADSSQVTDFGPGGRVFIRGRGGSVSEGLGLSWSSGGLGDGWERVYALAQASSGGSLSLEAVATGLSGTVYFDDLQLEESLFGSAGAPGPLSLVENGAMRSGGWTASSGSRFRYSTDAAFGPVALVQGSAFEDFDLYQTISLDQPGSRTYLFSGWAKASAVPLSGVEERRFELRAELYYSGESGAESHRASFSVDNEGWQFLSLPIVPKQPGKRVSQVKLSLSFGKDPNTALFTRVSFSRQEAQSYKYNSEGELISVTSSENEEQSFSYSGADLISQLTQGSGTYTYEYDSRHNMTKATNDGVSLSASYSASGNTSGTSLTAAGTAEKLSTSANYTENGNLLASQTDPRGSTISYAYELPTNVQTGQPSSVTDAMGLTRETSYDPASDRVTRVEIPGAVALSYSYSGGRLSGLVRSGDPSGKNLSYSMSYGDFGKMAGINVGSKRLINYTFGNNNGLLEQISYGNGESISYAHDALERISSLSYNDSESSAAEYAYSSGGSLGRVDDKLSGRSVNYSYDAIERLTSMTEQSGSVGIQRLRLGYDSSNRLTSKEYAVSPGLDGSFGETRSYGYTYREADGSLISMSLPGGANLSYAYDPLKRLSSRLLREGETEAVKRSYSYLPGAAENDTTLLISQLRNERGEELYSKFDYSYDPAGNIRSLSETRSSKTRQPEGGAVTASTQTEQSYVYDPQGQLLEEHSFTEAGNGDREAYSLFYSYDSGGNLLSWGDKNQPFTLSYEDETWPDLLTAFNGDPISYDAIGNPTLWRDNTAFTWANGRKLMSAVNSAKGLSVSYTYNAGSLRMSKTVNGVEHKYIWQGDKLVSEAYGGRELEFFYDESGKPYAMSHRSGPNAEAKLYYYVTNLQGDVLSLVDAEGFSAAEYWYNAWGLPMGSSGAMAEVNPLRYRGYYFDQETGLYYLKSRYYDPFVCRFINSDSLLSTGQGFAGCNSFSYCGNNPVIFEDADGYAIDVAFDIVSLAFSASDLICRPTDPWAWVAFIGDFIDVAVPFVSGIGEATKMINEARKMAERIDTASDMISVGSESVVRMVGPYRYLRRVFNHTGMEVHHIFEKRFFSILPGITSPRSMISVALTPIEHALYTKRWRDNIPYGQTPGLLEILDAARKVYSDNPQLLELAMKQINKLF